MSRTTPIAPEAATGKAQELLDAVKGKLGLVPKMTRAMPNSPAVLFRGPKSIAGPDRPSVFIRLPRTMQFGGCPSAGDRSLLFFWPAPGPRPSDHLGIE